MTQQIIDDAKDCADCNGSGDLVNIEGEWCGYCPLCCGTGNSNFQYGAERKAKDDTQISAD